MNSLRLIPALLLLGYCQAFAAVKVEIDIKTSKGCMIRFQHDPTKTDISKKRTVEWSGKCKSGYIDGDGVAIVNYEDGTKQTYKGFYRLGREEGVGVTEVEKPDGSKAIITGVSDRGLVQGTGNLQLTDAQGKVATYTGNLIDGRPEGKGRWEFPDGTVYEGDVKVWPNGNGQFTYKNGLVYEGEVKDKKPNGLGLIRMKDGTTISGYFSEGKLPISGHILFSNGSTYDGELKDLKPHGKGTSVSPDRTRYSGEFAEGKAEGYGTIERADGRPYNVRISNGSIERIPTPEEKAALAREERERRDAQRRTEIDQQAYENAVNACRARVASMPAQVGSLGANLARMGQCNLDPEAFRVETQPVVIVPSGPTNIRCTRTGMFVNCNSF